MDSSARVMLALVTNILLHPVQITRPEADDTVASLPLNGLFVLPDCLIDIVRRTAFELADEFADRQCRWNRHCDVDVRFNAADFVDERAGRLNNTLLDDAVCQRFNFGRHQWQAVLGM